MLNIKWYFSRKLFVSNVCDYVPVKAAWILFWHVENFKLSSYLDNWANVGTQEFWKNVVSPLM